MLLGKFVQMANDICAFWDNSSITKVARSKYLPNNSACQGKVPRYVYIVHVPNWASVLFKIEMANSVVAWIIWPKYNFCNIKTIKLK